MSIDIPVLQNPSRDEFYEHATQGIPVKLRGATQDWTLWRLLSAVDSDLERLRVVAAVWGDAEASVQALAAGAGADFGVHKKSGRWRAAEAENIYGTIRDYCERLISAEYGLSPHRTMYLQSFQIVGLGGAVHSLEFLGDIAILRDQLWMGNGGRTTLHYDESYNLINMMMGNKRIALVPPGYFEELDLQPEHIRVYGTRFSPVDLLVPDKSEENRSRAQRVPVVEVVLEPGESLFLPPYWWHQVESTGLNLAIQGWAEGFGPPADDMRTFESAGAKLTRFPDWAKTLPMDCPAARQHPEVGAYLNDLRMFLDYLPEHDVVGRTPHYWVDYLRAVFGYYQSESFLKRHHAELAQMYAPKQELALHPQSPISPFPLPDVASWPEARVESGKADNSLIAYNPPEGLQSGQMVHYQGQSYRVSWIFSGPYYEEEMALLLPEA